MWLTAPEPPEDWKLPPAVTSKLVPEEGKTEHTITLDFPAGISPWLLHPLRLGLSSWVLPGSSLHRKLGFSIRPFSISPTWFHLPASPTLDYPFHHPSTITVSPSQTSTLLSHLCASFTAQGRAYRERALCYTYSVCVLLVSLSQTSIHWFLFSFVLFPPFVSHLSS